MFLLGIEKNCHLFSPTWKKKQQLALEHFTPQPGKNSKALQKWHFPTVMELPIYKALYRGYDLIYNW